MADEADAAKITPADIQRVCGCGMYGHWFTRSQFTFMPKRHYQALAAAYPGHFARPWDDLNRDWGKVRGNGRDVINGKLEGMRSYFDNAHDSMHDVWAFPRVLGEERYGHATPKPVSMIERAVRSSCPDDGDCIEPFGGTGTTLIACENLGRGCRMMELSPDYTAVTLQRWADHTGQTPELLT